MIYIELRRKNEERKINDEAETPKSAETRAETGEKGIKLPTDRPFDQHRGNLVNDAFFLGSSFRFRYFHGRMIFFNV